MTGVAGARAVAHVLNAMPGPAARAPGLAGVALASPRLTLGCIADGVHVADELLSVVEACAPERTALVSDAIAAAGTGLARVRLGDVEVTVADDRDACRERGARAADVRRAPTPPPTRPVEQQLCPTVQ